MCYSLGITAVDPVGMDLLFERFLSDERSEWPDIDLDLPSGAPRAKGIQHVFDKYGTHGAAMTAVVITYRTRMAVREMGKVLGVAPDAIDRLARAISKLEHRESFHELEQRESLHEPEQRENLDELEQLIELGSVIIVAPDYIMGDEKELVSIWFQDSLKFDPGPSWAAVEEPILAIFGETDWFAPTEQNEPLLREILTNSGHKNYQIQIFPGTNHFFQPAETGSIGEIGTNPREFVPGFLELMSDWIHVQVGGE